MHVKNGEGSLIYINETMVFKTQEAIVMLHSALVMLVLDNLSSPGFCI